VFNTIHVHNTTYVNDISALLQVVDITYRIKKPEFDNLIRLYGKSLTRSKANEDYNTMLSGHIKIAYNMLSQKYIKDTLESYFSTNGVIAFIRDSLDELYTKQFDGFSKGDASYSAV